MIPYIMVFFTLITCLIDIVLIWRNSVLELKDKQYFSRMLRIVFFSLFQQGYSVNYQKKAVFYISLSFHYHHEDITHSPQEETSWF